MADEKDKILAHESDGIQEYDNDLPIWWRNIFILTGIFAVAYVIYTHMIADTPGEKLAKQLAALDALRQSSVKSAEAVENKSGDLKALAADKTVIAKGQEIFQTNCVACHGTQGEGIVGPNLTDDRWIHGGDLESIRHTITEGVPEKGMISWKASLTPDQIMSVTAYVWSLYGTNPPNGKAPEGEVFQR